MDFVTLDLVKDTLGLGPFDTVDDAWLNQCVDAANTFVTIKRPDLAKQGAVAPADVVLGTRMLAARWYSRRNGAEVAALNEFGVAPPTIDRDVETLLEVGRAFRPVVA